MKYFKLIDKQVDIQPLLDELYANEETWLANTGRQTSIKCQSQTQSIALRWATARDDLRTSENQETCWTGLEKRFPLARSYMERMAEELGGTLSRASIVRLQPKGQVAPHTDYGSYYLIRDRYHLVLKSTKGSLMISGDEKNTMQKGELWWLDNHQHHAAVNISDEWRIHYIFDILPDKHKDLARNAIPPSSFFKRG